MGLLPGHAVFGIANHFFGGLVVTLLCGTGAATALALSRETVEGFPRIARKTLHALPIRVACAPRRQPRQARGVLVARLSVTMLAIGTAVTLSGTCTGAVAVAMAGTVLAGIGYGASGLATFGALARLAGPAGPGPAGRGGLFAVAYTVAFLAFSLPAVAAGYATTVAGLHVTVTVYASVVIALGLAAFAIQRPRRLTPGR
jgi:hypothetical protein